MKRKATAAKEPTIAPALLSRPRAADFLSVSEGTVQNFVRAGVLTPIRIPGIRRTVFAVDELRALIARWRSMPSPLAVTQADEDMVLTTRG